MPLDTLSQLYLAATVFGWGFILVSFFLGGLGEHDHSGDSGHSGHAHLHMEHGHHHADHAHIPGATGSHGTANGHGGGHGGAHSSGHNQNNLDESQQSNAVVATVQNNTYFQIMSVLNPTSISVFLGFVGLSGLAIKTAMPWLGLVSLVPAGVIGFVAVVIMRNVFAYLTARLNVSNTHRSGDAIGHIAEVSTPISAGGTGEVTYVIGTSRFNAAAKCSKPEEAVSRGSKVVIVEREGHLVFVEPYQEN